MNAPVIIKDEVIKLFPDKFAINLLYDTFLQSRYLKGFPDDQKNMATIHNMVRSFQDGLTHVFCPIHKGKRVGLMHGHFMDPYQFEGHQLIFKEFQGKKNHHIQEKAVKDTAATIFNMFHDCKHIVGFTPSHMRWAISAAKRFGFEERGSYKDYYTFYGKPVDAKIMVLRKGDL